MNSRWRAKGGEGAEISRMGGDDEEADAGSGGAGRGELRAVGGATAAAWDRGGSRRRDDGAAVLLHLHLRRLANPRLPGVRPRLPATTQDEPKPTPRSGRSGVSPNPET